MMLPRSISSLVIILFLLSTPSSAQTSCHWEVDQGWLVVSLEGQVLLQKGSGSSVEVNIDGSPFLIGATPEVTLQRLDQDSYHVVYQRPTGILTQTIHRIPDFRQAAWERRLVYINTSGHPQDLLGALMRVAPVTRMDATIWTPQNFYMAELNRNQIGCVAYRSEGDMYTLNVRPGDVESAVSACWRLQPGQQAEIGTQIVWIQQGDASVFRTEAQAWYQFIGLQTTPNVPPWLGDLIYYKASAGGTIESRNSDVGGYANFSHQLDYLADLGVSAILYHSIVKHKSPPNPNEGGWNVYGITDYSEIDPITGGAKAFHDLADATRRKGMIVLSEICLNGYYSSQAAVLKDWWSTHRDGSHLLNFGGASMDYSSPAWQQEMEKVARWFAQDFGILGMRMDLGSGSGDNWSSPLRNHASYSYLGGSLEMLQAVSRGSTVSQYCPILISEDLVHQPERLEFTPVLYGYDLKVLLAGLPGDLSDAARINALLRNFFERERGSLPVGALTVRTLGGLNEVVNLSRPSIRFGVGLKRALYGIMLMVPGVVQMVQEEEVGSYEVLRQMNWARRRVPELAGGQTDYLSLQFAPEVFTVLRSMGDSHAIGLSNLSGKSIETDLLLPAGIINTPTSPVFDAVSGRQAVIENGKLPWRLEPYEVSILRIGRPPIGSIPLERYQPQPSLSVESHPFLLKTEDESLVLQNGTLCLELFPDQAPWQLQSDSSIASYTSPYAHLELLAKSDSVEVHYVSNHPQGQSPSLRVVNTDRWLVQARTGLLADRLLRRHFPFPEGSNYFWTREMVWGKAPTGLLYNNVYPTGRLWQSVVEPLAGSLAFLDPSSAGLSIDQIQTNAGNLVLTDRTDEGWEKIQSDPYGLDLRFYLHDPDLSPKVSLFGMDNWWSLASYPKPGSGELKLTLTLRPINSLSDIPPAPVMSVGMRSSELERVGEQFVSAEDGSLFFAKQGKVTWLIPDTLHGRYRILLRLRHSSFTPEGRDMVSGYLASLDDQVIPLEWVKYNTGRIHTAHFGDVLTPEILLDGQRHTLTLATTQEWCAIYPPFVLIKKED